MMTNMRSAVRWAVSTIFISFQLSSFCTVAGSISAEILIEVVFHTACHLVVQVAPAYAKKLVCCDDAAM